MDVRECFSPLVDRAGHDGLFFRGNVGCDAEACSRIQYAGEQFNERVVPIRGLHEDLRLLAIPCLLLHVTDQLSFLHLIYRQVSVKAELLSVHS